jgi:L-amino acid N-acyltransferase YncA
MFCPLIAANNEASLAMAHSMGFSEVGAHIDEEDGLELYCERRLDRWPVEWGPAKVGYW